MAKKQDNMIELIAKLNPTESKKQIIDDLNTIAKEINSDKNFSFQIKCTLDQKSINSMKSQLAGIFNNLKISPTAGITEQVEEATKSRTKPKYDNISVIKGETTDETLARAKEQLNAQLKKNGDEVTRVTKAYENASGALQQFYVQVERNRMGGNRL